MPGYLALSAAVMCFCLGYVINGRFSGDAFRHAATVDRLASSIDQPQNPLILGDAPDPGFSPYAATLGLVSRATGVAGIDLLPLVGLLLVALLLALWPAAITAIVGEVRVAPLALVLTLVAWGWQPWRFSGYLNLNSLGFGLGYPSLAAWVGLLGAVALADRMRSHPGPTRAGLLGLVLAFVALTHPLTLLGALPLTAGIALRGSPGRTAAAAYGSAVVAAALLVLAWPLYPALELLDGGGEYDASNRATYAHLLDRTFLALPGLVLLVPRARRAALDPLVLTASIGLAVVAMGAVTGRWTAGRALPFVLLCAHLLLADWVVRRAGHRHPAIRSRRQALGVVALIAVVGVVGCAPGIVSAVPRSLLPADLRTDTRLQSEAQEFDFLRPHGSEAAVLVSSDRAAARAALAYGFASLRPPYPMAALAPAALDVRAQANQGYLFGDAALRQRLIARYGITHLLVRTGDQIDMSGHVRVAGNADFLLLAVAG